MTGGASCVATGGVQNPDENCSGDPLSAWLDCPTDFNHNADTGFADLTAILLHWGPCCTGAQGQQAAPGGGDNGLPASLAEAWLGVGGLEALLDNSITPLQVAECMSNPSPALRFAALVSLLAQEVN